MLFDYDWPGNIRQMNQVVRRFQLLADDPEVGVADLQQRISSRYPGYRKLHDHLSNRTRAKVASDRQAVSVEDDLHFRKSALDARLEKDRAEAESLKIMLYRDAVKLCGGNHTKAALLLGVDRNQIDRTLKEETAKSAAETD
jgi:DNA-binding NtrC family response regulator